jgi:hypothetical protein
MLLSKVACPGKAALHQVCTSFTGALLQALQSSVILGDPCVMSHLRCAAGRHHRRR